MRRYILKLVLYLLKRSDEKTKRDIIREAVKDLFCTVEADDILRVKGDVMYFQGKALDQSYRKDLRAQAEIIENMLLWKVLRKDIEYQLRKKMFEEAKTDMDVVWGQLITWLYDVMKTRIEQLKH